jgi:hypothetical protein
MHLFPTQRSVIFFVSLYVYVLRAFCYSLVVVHKVLQYILNVCKHAHCTSIQRAGSVLPGIDWQSEVLPGIARQCKVLPGVAWQCKVLPGMAFQCKVLPWMAWQCCLERHGNVKNCREWTDVVKFCLEWPGKVKYSIVRNDQHSVKYCLNGITISSIAWKAWQCKVLPGIAWQYLISPSTLLEWPEEA